MTEQWSETEKDSYFNPDGYEEVNPPVDEETETDYTTLFEAPDYALFIKHQQTPRGKEYADKVSSMLKAGALGAFKAGNAADACSLLHYGPAFAKRCGDLTDVSQGAAKAIDVLTAPDNPWALFAITAIPFALQMFRNHEQDAEEVHKGWKQARAERKRMKQEGLLPPKREGRGITIRGPFGRKFTIRVKLPTPALFFNVMRAQTHEPKTLINEVLSDPKLIQALRKHDINVVVRRNPSGNSDV